jgi:hypothetical protein
MNEALSGHEASFQYKSLSDGQTHVANTRGVIFMLIYQVIV